MAQETELDHVLRRWPTWRRRIMELVAADEGFREVCQDFQELASWIEENKSTRQLETSIELLESLALEITGTLTRDHEARPP